MKKVIKWFMIAVGFLAVVVIAMLLLLPVFLDMQKYKPYIEHRVSEAVGRPFAMGDKFKVSLFPWAGVSFSDLHLGNPPGFDEKDLYATNVHENAIRGMILSILFEFNIPIIFTKDYADTANFIIVLTKRQEKPLKEICLILSTRQLIQ